MERGEGIKFLHSLSIDQNAKLLALLWLLVDKMKSHNKVPFEKKVVFLAFNWKYFDVNIVRFFTHSSLNQTKLKSTKKEPVTSDLSKRAKKVSGWGNVSTCLERSLVVQIPAWTEVEKWSCGREASFRVKWNQIVIYGV